MEPSYGIAVAQERTLSEGKEITTGEPLETDINVSREGMTLRKVSESISMATYLLSIVECAERASYYGARSVFSNFIQFPLPAGGDGTGAPPPGTQLTAGALDRELRFANAFVLLFQFLVCVVPILGAWLADTKLGRYTVVTIGVWISAAAHILMTAGAIPSLLRAEAATAPFIISLFMLAFGTGLFKPNIAPTIVDQYRNQRPYVRRVGSREVMVDPETTVQRILLIFYGLVNVGAFTAIASTFAEKKVGYWLAFLVPSLIYLPLPFLLLFFRSRITKVTPDGSELHKVFKIIGIAFRRQMGRFWVRGFWDAAKPSVLDAESAVTSLRGTVDWSDELVEDVRRTVAACQIFLFFPLYNLNDGGIGSVATSQGSTMTTNGAPNDLLNNINPLTIVIAIPILTYIVYPLLNYHKIKFGRISRLTFGFTLAWVSGIIGAIVQWRVYETSPCRYYATGCDIGDGVSPLSIWWQVPNVALGGLSECFCYVTAYELAYARSPKSMRALVTSLFLFSSAISSALGLIITPAIVDPYLIWVWAGPAIALFAQTCFFHWNYRHMDHDDFMTHGDGEDNSISRLNT